MKRIRYNYFTHFIFNHNPKEALYRFPENCKDGGNHVAGGNQWHNYNTPMYYPDNWRRISRDEARKAQPKVFRKQKG